MDASTHPGASKRRQYASDQTQAYTGTGATLDSLTQAVDSLSFPPPEEPNANLQPRPQLRRDTDLMTYPPNPADLALPPPAIVLPKGTMQLVERDDAPFYQQPSIGAVPKNDTILHQTKLPFGFIVSPHRILKAEDSETPIPVVEDGIIARCQRCLAYINPYVRFLDYNTRWRCSLCGTNNAVPPEFGFSHVMSGAEYRSRAELTHTVVDFAATTDYIRNPPQAPAFAFLLDVSEAAITSGLFATAVRTIGESLDSLPNAEGRTRVAVICFDSALHFFKFTTEARPSLQTFEMLVVPDLEEPSYLPCTHDDLLVNLSDSELRTQLDELFGRLPELFNGTNTGMSRDCATGPALDAARALLAEGGGGKIVLISASAPNLGRGALDSPKQDQIEHTVDKSAASFYHDLAIACVNACVTVDLFLVGHGKRYVGLSTLCECNTRRSSDLRLTFFALALLPHYTGGLTMYYPSLNSEQTTTPTTTTKFPTELTRVLSLPILLEAELRIRCSRGISVKSTGMNGDFFLQGTDRAVLASMPPDRGYMIELQIDMTLGETPAGAGVVVIQTALLHTTSTGRRAIRVVSSALPVVHTAAEVFASADARAIVAIYAKQAVQRSVVRQRSAEEHREKLLYKTVEDICAAYAAIASVNASQASLQLRLPEAMKMLPVLMLGLYKRITARDHWQLRGEQALDVAAYTRTILTGASLHQLIGYIYPAVYSLHNMPSDVGLPQALPLTSSWWEPHGLYLIDPADGQSVFLWVGRTAVPQLVQDVFGPGTGSYDELRIGKVDLPELETAVSRVARTLIAAIRDRLTGGAVRYPDVIVVKDEPGPDRAHWREEVVQMLIQDRLDDLRPSYRQFLVKVHERMR
ncbi:hypothetical protein HMN09_00135500 [Mycena chlorophos]|uniref:Protein transporter SEC24 n=1 Tax=Mycena chlorophos TaxID=658473 RepID=A0A8H6TKJ1_MYCCL|nr:hypothetical protein HMN09_00135500 [Mycena chlorophos]